MDGYLKYLSLIANKGRKLPIDDFSKLGLELIEVSDENRSWGKLVLTPPVGGVIHSGQGVAISKGIRVCPINSFLGFTRHDEVIAIKRDAPSKVIPFELMQEWGKKQKAMIIERGLKDLYGNTYLGLLFGLDLYEEDTPILLNKTPSNLQVVTVGALCGGQVYV